MKAHNIYDLSLQVLVNCEFYLKSEADKVIAELKKEKEYAIEHMAEVINAQERELRYQKYKRCLAMVRRCHNQKEIYERDSYDWELEDAAKCSLWNKAKIMRKWHEHWLELAEKFKEAK